LPIEFLFTFIKCYPNEEALHIIFIKISIALFSTPPLSKLCHFTEREAEPIAF
jgi:hypothetical protein